MLRCVVCAHENAEGALFCARCTSPSGVVPLHELTEADRRRCLQALFEVLAESHHAGPAVPLDGGLWRAYLNAFWLRPETALVVYAEALALRALAASGGPWLDLGCGDGIHAAIYSGWRFDDEFDAFSSLDLNAADIYNHFDPSQFSLEIKERGRPIDFGVDIKGTAVARAKALGAFKSVAQADATSLPFKDCSVGIIFSNMLRDLGDPLPAALKECRRVLKDDGQLLISTMTPQYAENLYFAPAAHLAEQRGRAEEAREFLKLDRGRSVFCRRQLSPEQWQSLLAPAGLAVRNTRTIVGQKAIRFWDVGLRPFSHPLLFQRQAWQKAGVLREVKRSLVAGLDFILDPLLQSLTEGIPCMSLLDIRKA